MSDRYVLLERLAVGGMGEVFLARQLGPGGFKRTVIVKRVLPDKDAEDDSYARFFDEARIAASITHENVVSIIEVGELGDHGESPFLAMEYVHGVDAATLVRRAVKANLDLPLLAVARILDDTARGLHHAHVAHDVNGKPLHIVHRDVAPKNILVRVDGVSKITDFGVAMADAKLSKTATGAVAGTLSYMAPEQVSARTVDATADQFSLGVVFWELLTRKRLFKGEGPSATVELIATRKVPAPSRYRTDVPAGIDAVVLRMLQRNPTQRFATLLDAASAIEAAAPDVVGAIARKSVADVVALLAGSDLATRQKRIEEEREPSDLNHHATMSVVRPPANAPLVPSGDANTAVVSHGSDAQTAVDRRRMAAHEGIVVPSTSRAPLAWAAAAAVAILGGTFAWVSNRPTRAPAHVAVDAGNATAADAGVRAAVKLTTTGDSLAQLANPSLRGRFRHVADLTFEARTADYLRALAAYGPGIFRESLLLDAAKDKSIKPALAAHAADVVAGLVAAHIELLLAQLALPVREREDNTLDTLKKERALEAQARAALKPLKALRTSYLDTYAVLSGAPLKWIEPGSPAQAQRELVSGDLEGLRNSRVERMEFLSAVCAHAGMAPSDSGQLRTIVNARETLLEQMGTASVVKVPKIDATADDELLRGMQLISSAVPLQWQPVVAEAAFVYVSTIDEWRAFQDTLPSARTRR